MAIAITLGAGFLGGQHILVTGRQRGDTLDNLKHRALNIELNTRKALPIWRSKKLRGGGPRGSRFLAIYKAGGARGGGGRQGTLAYSFDGWAQRCPSLARVPLFCRVLKPFPTTR